MAYRRRLILGGALLFATLALALIWKLHASYGDDRRNAEAQTTNFARAMDAHVTNVIEIVDLALIRSADGLKTLTAEELRKPEVVRQFFAASGRSPDTSYWLMFVNAEGVGVVASNELAVAGVSYADRPYFSTHLQGVDAGLFVGGPQVGKVSRRRLFFMSRAVRSPTGQFLGVVAAPVDASVLAGVFQNALFAPGLSVALAHTDGKLIARAPRFEESFASDWTASPLFSHLKDAPSGTYESTSVIDGMRRVYAYQSLVGVPLVIVVGMASQAWATGLLDDALVAGIALLIILTILFLSGRFALKTFAQLDASETAHRALNADLRGARERLARSEDRMRMVTDHVPALVSYIDADQRYVFRNAAHAAIQGIDADAMVGKTVHEVYGDDAYRLVADEIARALSGTSVEFERAIAAEGLTHHWKYVYTPDLIDGKVVGLYAVVTDLTDRRRVEQDLRSQARSDALTGLPNRNQLYERLEQAIPRCRRYSTKLACLYLDIDHFKRINDTYGHGSGDLLLRQFGARLQASVRETDLVARIAGDEFVVVLESIGNAMDAEIVARKIVDAMQIPFTLEGEQKVVTTSIGVIVSDGRGEDPESLLKKADAQLYVAKRKGKNLFELYDAATDGA